MLTDAQIDRYCRQLILPEVGAAGQQRLLRSTVRLHGRGDAALVCASYLAGAGVGALALEGAPLHGATAAALGLDGGGEEEIGRWIARRNPDCRWLPAAGLARPSAAVTIGTPLPARLPEAAVMLWGGADAERLICAQLPAGRACRECLDAFVGAARADEPSTLLGTFIALATLRALLAVEPIDRPVVWQVDWERPQARPMALPSRPGCVLCAP